MERNIQEEHRHRRLSAGLHCANCRLEQGCPIRSPGRRQLPFKPTQELRKVGAGT
jgi:hypothetical protein